jgi:hypothetical protein
LTTLRGLDEPFWTAVAESTLAVLETALGHHDAAPGHLTEMRALAERVDILWLVASAAVQRWSPTTGCCSQRRPPATLTNRRARSDLRPVIDT